MSTPSPTLDPRTNAEAWSYIVLNGIPSPGSIPRGGVRGFKRKTGWDKKRGKGAKGATLTLTTAPPVDGEIAFQLIAGFDAQGRNSTDFADWDFFVQFALAIVPEKQAAQGLTIAYPGFSSIGLVAVVVEDYSPPEHVGKGLYIATIKLCEWQKPPAVSIVSTVGKTGQNANGGTRRALTAGELQTAEFDELKQQKEDQIAMTSAANKVAGL